MNETWTCTKCGFTWYSDLPTKPPADNQCNCKNGEKPNWIIGELETETD